MGRHKKKEGSPYDKIREILRVIEKRIDGADAATSAGKKESNINAAIVATETLWQELRYIGQNR